MLRLKDKVAIITGSSRGLGKILSIHFAREGAKVVIAARSEVENQQLTGTIYKPAEIVQSENGRALPVKCDVTSEESIHRCAVRVAAEVEALDILFNNAAIHLGNERLSGARPEALLETLHVNAVGAVIVAQKFVPLLKEGLDPKLSISHPKPARSHR